MSKRTTHGDLARERQEAAKKWAAASKPLADVKRRLKSRYGRNGLTAAEVKKLAASWRAPTYEELLKQPAAERAARDALSLAQDVQSPSPGRNVIFLVDEPGSDLQTDYEMLLDFTVPYEHEKLWHGAKEGFGQVQLASIDPWDLCRLPKPQLPSNGFSLTTAIDHPDRPDLPLIAAATARLQHSLARLEDIGIIEPGRAPGSWRIEYGTARVGSRLEHDPVASARAIRTGSHNFRV